MHDPSATPPRRIPAGGRKVGRKPAFTADDVVAAAVAEGVDRFTLSAVAERLGVVTAAIYRLFGSREDLVTACLDAAGATIVLPEPAASWRDTLRRWADECWRVCEDYPGLSRLVYAYPAAPTRIENVFKAYADHLAAQGKTPRQAMFALDFIGDTVFASHLGVESMRAVDEDGRTGLDTVRDAIGESGSPLHPEESWTTRKAMDTKIEFILTGLEQNWPEF
ncbi:TetR/AcrR family transcriptional regulator [Aeromicrobium sp. YIM 150415]|uniref:TetR/AcrR family transcriptional regulator n=1 Tax=Aeromicrobium sp. YIM 150415 TaxID=2803912 RepID=UPI00196600DC|nr:TetR/AcrR family transcriptional regulator [Aeromicrobium sp. YIM 150415]MBM9463641.1 TetR/AcrR family transcriptional regulator [Aeromicrobium sp. YIM 150415]